MKWYVGDGKKVKDNMRYSEAALMKMSIYANQ